MRGEVFTRHNFPIAIHLERAVAADVEPFSVAKCERIEQGRLARPAGPHDGHQLAGLDVPRNCNEFNMVGDNSEFQAYRKHTIMYECSGILFLCPAIKVELEEVNIL